MIEITALWVCLKVMPALVWVCEPPWPEGCEMACAPGVTACNHMVCNGGLDLSQHNCWTQPSPYQKTATGDPYLSITRADESCVQIWQKPTSEEASDDYYFHDDCNGCTHDGTCTTLHCDDTSEEASDD